MEKIFSLLPLIRLNDLQLFYAAISSFSFKGFTRAGSYWRYLVYFDKGKRCVESILVYRVRIRGCLSGRTLSIRPKLLVFGSSHSLRYILSMLFAYHNRPVSTTVEEFCHSHDISRPTLTSWQALLNSDILSFYRILLELKKCSDDLLSLHPAIFPEVLLPGFVLPFSCSFPSILPEFCLPP